MKWFLNNKECGVIDFVNIRNCLNLLAEFYLNYGLSKYQRVGLSRIARAYYRGNEGKQKTLLA